LRKILSGSVVADERAAAIETTEEKITAEVETMDIAMAAQTAVRAANVPTKREWFVLSSTPVKPKGFDPATLSAPSPSTPTFPALPWAQS
jgi:hypothetical protein